MPIGPIALRKFQTNKNSLPLRAALIAARHEIGDNESDLQPEENSHDVEAGNVHPLKDRWEKPASGLRMPPFLVEDMDLLLYDIFLILNLVVASSFWVVHRLDFTYLGYAFSEGCLLCLLWIASGLYYGAFLDSAVDGHYGSADERGGPKAAMLLACQTYVGTINLRLLFALVVALCQHRPVGGTGGEEFLPLEIGFGLMLMSGWRALHSSFAPRFK